MNYQDRYNSERYLDMTAYLALRNIEREERRLRMREDRIYRRGEAEKELRGVKRYINIFYRIYNGRRKHSILPMKF